MSLVGKIGDIVCFNYYGGSRYGAPRRVKVTEETLNTLSGIEVDSNNKDIGGYKRYIKYKIKDLVVVTNSFDVARIELQTFLINNKEYALVMVKEFNKKWNVNYKFKDGILTEIPKNTSKNISIIVTKNNQNGDITTEIGGIKLKIRGNFLYVNDYYVTKISNTNLDIIFGDCY